MDIENKVSGKHLIVSCAELRLRQSVFESKDDGLSSSYASGQQVAPEHKPTLEETVESLFRRLREKRQALGLPDNMKVLHSMSSLTSALFYSTILTSCLCVCVCVCIGDDPGSDGVGEDYAAEVSAVF